MSNKYYITRDGNLITSDDELYHYGVKGMKWGVRKATKQLTSASDSAGRNKAVGSLQKHRAKASAKVSSLKKKQMKLQSKVDKAITSSDVKASKVYAKAAKKEKKAYSRFTTKRRSEKLEFKAKKLKARADVIKTRSDKAKARLAKNKKTQELLNKGISDIDQILANRGKEYLKGL